MDRYIIPRNQNQIQNYWASGVSDSKYNALLKENNLGLEIHKAYRNHKHQSKTFIHNRITNHATVEKVLDAPCISQSLSTNLTDWKNGMIAIALDNEFFVMNENHKIKNRVSICSSANYVSSVLINPMSSNMIAIGTNSGNVILFDSERTDTWNTIAVLPYAITSFLWLENVLVVGDWSGSFSIFDTRAPNHSHQKTVRAHDGPVYNLKSNGKWFSSCGKNSVSIWQLGYNNPSHKIASLEKSVSHKITGNDFALKAMEWCPWNRNILATGGNGCVFIWDIQSQNLLQQSSPIQSKTEGMKSPIYSMVWFDDLEFIVTGHGGNEVVFWECNKKQLNQKQNALTRKWIDYSNSGSVMHMTKNSNNSCFITASTDETLKFWKWPHEKLQDSVDYSNKKYLSGLENTIQWQQQNTIR